MTRRLRTVIGRVPPPPPPARRSPPGSKHGPGHRNDSPTGRGTCARGALEQGSAWAGQGGSSAPVRPRVAVCSAWSAWSARGRHRVCAVLKLAGAECGPMWNSWGLAVTFGWPWCRSEGTTGGTSRRFYTRLPPPVEVGRRPPGGGGGGGQGGAMGGGGWEGRLRGGGPGGAIWVGEGEGGVGGHRLPLPPLALNLTIPSR